ncbi:MAG: cytochrome [Ferruginibacter sp.]|nr:cytochrome [Ferruginibacter sp.]
MCFSFIKISVRQTAKIYFTAFILLTFVGCQESEKPPYKPAAIDKNPTAVYLSPEESMKTMHLPEGYHLQLVASEPMIQEPVAIVWDGNGRMYVAEMRSYMRDINGTGEHFPTCRISILEDTDGDGKMDKHSVFIDSLVLPRMMLVLDDRLIVNETYSYNMYSYRDTNGDGIADEKKIVYQNDTADNANLEHQKSGLIWNIDNYIYVTANPVRYRYDSGMLKVDTLADSPGGQWGLTNDDFGRLFFSAAGGEVPALNFQQNPEYGQLNLDSQRINDFDSVWPIIATPDVQGGKMRLRNDSTLNHFTASCGQAIFRGDRLPVSMKGDLFICEPVGRLIRRSKVMNKGGVTVLKNAYEKAEFLTSSDMNFRPVNMTTGPDGCLYIVDMYHGIIQESNWTKEDSYLRPQILRKQLDKNIGRGRIYRLVHEGYSPGPRPNLLNASNQQLLTYLSHPNGWWRDNAQKLLVIHGDKSVVPELEKLALGKRTFWERLKFWKDKTPEATRVQALWTLEGLHSINKELLLKAYNDDEPAMRVAAIRMSEPNLVQGDEDLLSNMEHFKSDASADVRIQLALSLRYSKSEKAKALLKELALNNAGNKFLTTATAKSLEEGDESLNELKASIASMAWGDRRSILRGAINYKQLCSTCHGAEGKGVSSMLAPPLAGSPRVNGHSDLLVRILLNGLKGPVDHKNYPDVMPAQNSNSNEYIASVLSYIRNSMGNKANVIKPDDVKKIRKEIGDRQNSWTLEELDTVGVRISKIATDKTKK